MARKEYKDVQEVMAVFMTNKPREIKGHEIDGWCGLEGTGYIVDIEAETSMDDDDSGHQIVMDVTPKGIVLGVYYGDGSYKIYFPA